MTDLSPAAQAVREAAEKQTDMDFRYAPQIAAAVLRAAVDQVLPEESECPSLAPAHVHFLRQERQDARQKFLFIATELESHP